MIVLHETICSFGRHGQARPAHSMVTDMVVQREGATAPETMFPFARVFALRVSDGAVGWSGYADALGRYRAVGLEDGETYVLVGIDPHRHYKATAAGPVVSVREVPA